MCEREAIVYSYEMESLIQDDTLGNGFFLVIVEIEVWYHQC